MVEKHRTWSHRSLKDKRYVYGCTDGVHFNIRLETASASSVQCILSVDGATAEGKKELIAIVDGDR
ncbi:transposase [Singulisphaera acidiphila]|uniref:transposase n=1 Tax=Singulisphaera acidiphila TaxID=466153 RepID=UPI0002474411|nr:transposase [Singulisphaera acidiphila]